MALLPNEKLITTKEAGELSGYTSDYLSRLVRSGKIAGKKVGHSWLVDKESLNRFLGEQDDHKSDRARELARARAREYRVHRSVVLRAAKALTEPRSMPQQFVRMMSALPSRAALRRLRSHALALSVALLVLTFGTLGAQAEMLPRFAQNAAAVAEQTALGLEATFGDIPSHIAQRFTDVEREMRTHFSRTATTGTAASARIAPRVLRNLSVSLSFGQPETTSSDRAAFSIRAASASKAAVPAVTAGDIRAFAADAYAVFTSPSRVTDAAANAHVSVGEEAYGAIRAALAAYRSTLDEFGARTLSAAAAARDTLRASPAFVARTNLALGESVIAAARFVLDAEIAASYGLAAAAPASARATSAIVGGTGDLLAGFTVRAAVEAPSRLARAILDASEAGAKIPEAVFSAEYAAATGFIAATNAVSGRYALALALLGEVGYESARGSRALVQSIPEEIRHPRQLQPSDLEHAGAALASAVSDAYRGALDKTSLAFDTFARTPKVAAVLNSPPMRALERAGEAGLAAALPALSAGEKAALAIYNTIHGFFTFTTDSLANLFMPPPTIVYPIAAPARPKVVTAPAPRTFNSYTTIVRGVSEDFVQQSLNSLRSSLLATIADSIRPVYMQTVTNAATTQQVNMIQDLHDLIVRNGDFRNSIFDNGIRVSATDGRFTNLYGGSASLTSLTVSGATSLATTTITGDLSVSGSITPSVISAADYIRAPYFVATSTTATSTFAGSLAIDTNGFVYATSTKNVGIGVLSPAALLAVQNSTSTQPIFVASSAAGAEVYRITNAGFVGIGTTTPGYALAVEGSSSLGNQAIAGYFTATSTTATSTFAGRLAVGTSTPWGDGLFTVGVTTPLLYISSNTGRIGVGTSSPSVAFDVFATSAIRLPVGTSAQRPSTGDVGYVRFNTTTHQFEGYGDNAVWQGLGGVIDADQDTKITAEDSAGADNDQLKFFTFGSERMRIDSNGLIGIGTTTPFANLSIAGSAGGTTNLFALSTSTAAFATTTALTIDSNGNLSLLNGANLTVGGNTIHTGTLTQTGLATFTNGFLSNASSTITSGLFTMSGGASTTNITASGTASTTNLIASASVTFQNLIGMLSSNGTSGTSARTLTGTANQITITNGDGTGGNPTFSLPSLLAFTNASTSQLSVFQRAYFGGTSTTTIDSAGSITLPTVALLTAPYASTTMVTATTASTTNLIASASVTFQNLVGMLSSNGTSGTSARTLTGTANQITITNGDGTGGNPTFSLPSLLFITNASSTALSSLDYVSVGRTATTTFVGDYGASSVRGSVTVYGNTTSGAGSSLTLQRGSTNGDNSLVFNDQTGSPLLKLYTSANTGYSYLNGQQSYLSLGMSVGGEVLRIDTSNNARFTGNVIPSANQQYDLGTTAVYWNNAYINNIVANNLSSASTSIAGTNTTSFSINSNNPTSDAQDMSLIFYRGAGAPSNAVLSWNSTLKRFEFNQNAYIANASASTGSTTLRVAAVAGQTGALTSWLDSSGNVLSAVTASGNIGVGTSSPYAMLSVAGQTVAQNFTATSTTATNTFPIVSMTSATSTNFFAGRLTANTFSAGQTASTTIDSSGNLATAGTLQVTGQTTLATSLSGLLAGSSGVVYSTATSSLAIGSSLSNSGTLGSQVGGTASTLSLNMANANSWTALQSFLNASSTIFSNTGTAYFGATATSSFSSAGALTLITPLLVSSGGTGQNTFSSSQLLYGAGTGALQSVATSSLAVGTGLTNSGTLGSQVGGTNASISFAAIAANSLWANNTGASAVPTAIATSSLFTWSGTGDVVRTTSPTLVTPALGTPSSLVLTNATGLPVAGGGTGLSSVGDGQLLFGSGGTTALTALATSTGGFLTNSYTTGRPSWVATSSLNVAISDTTGTLAVARGGTGQTSFTADQIHYGNFATVATSSLAIGASLSNSGTLGSQIGGTASSLSLNMANANTWTALQSFANASTSLFSSYGPAYFGATATSSFSSAGALTLITPLLVGSGGTGQSTFTSSQLLYGNGTAALSSVATSSLAVGTGLTNSGTLGAQVGGTNASISFAAIAANSLWANNTGSSAVPTAIATSSLFTWNGTGLVVRDTSPTIATPTITGLSTLASASSTLFSANQAYFGATATSTFSSNGSLTLPTIALLTAPYASTTMVTATTASTTNLTVSSLTANRVPYITTANAFTDSANLTFDGTTLTPANLTVTTNTTLSNLTASRLVATDGSKILVSTITAGNLLSSVTGTTGTNNLVFSTSPTIATPTFTGLATMASASTTLFSSYGPAYFGATATSTFDSAGNLAVGGTLSVAGLCVEENTLLKIRRRRKKRRGENDEDDEYDYLYLPIKDVLPGDEVLSLDQETNAFVYRRIKHLLDTGVQKTFRITLEDGRSIETTARHPYLVRTRAGHSQEKRTIAFIDYANIKAWARSLEYSVDLKKLHDGLVSANVSLFRFYYGTDGKNEKAASFFHKIASFGYVVVTKAVHYFSISFSDLLEQSLNTRWLHALPKNIQETLIREAKRLDAEDVRLLQPKANFDVEITTDALRLVNEFDHLILFSGDGDFISLLTQLHALGKTTTVVSGKKYLSGELKESAHAWAYLEHLNDTIEFLNPLPGAYKKPQPALRRVWKKGSNSIADLLGLSSVKQEAVDNGSNIVKWLASGVDAITSRFTSPTVSYLWKPVSELAAGQEIGVMHSTPYLDYDGKSAGVNRGLRFDRIQKIEEVGEKQMYDIEVDGTHNFIAGHLMNRKTGEQLSLDEESTLLSQYKNDIGDLEYDAEWTQGLPKIGFGGIVAHNTAIFNQASSTLFSANQAYFGATATSSFSSAGALTLITPLLVGSGGTGQTTFTSSQLLYGAGTGALQSVATSSLAVGTGISVTSGTLGSQVGGTAVTIGIANNALTLAQLPQVSAGYILGNNTGATANVTSFATSTLFGTGTGGQVLAWNNGVPQFIATTTIPLAGDVGGTLSATVIGANKVTLGMLATLAANSVIGNITGSSATPTAVATSSLFTWSGTGDVVRATSPTIATPTITGLATMASASTSQLSVFQNAYFGATATSTFTSAGRLGVLNSSPSYPIDVTGDINISLGSNYKINGANLSPGSWVASGNDVYNSNSGNIGIGTTTPYSRLSVWGGGTGATAMFELTNSASTTLTSVLNDGTVYMKGNVGIGTTNPGVKLEVSGAPTGYTKQIIRNTAAGTGNGSQLSLGSDTDADNFMLQSFSTTFTTSADGSAVASGARVYNEGTGGLSLASGQAAMRFYTGVLGNGALTEKMRIDTAGNVGIGTTTPQEKLSVVGRILATNFRLQPGYLGAVDAPAYSFSDDTDTGIYNGGANILRFSTAGADRVTIDASGNVGIGTTGPLSKLQVDGTYVDPDATAHGTVEFNSNTSFAIDKGGSISLGGAYTGTTVTQFGSIVGAKENVTDTNYAGYLGFHTRPAGSTALERMRITSTGNVGIGTTAPGQFLTLNHATAVMVAFQRAGTEIARIGEGDQTIATGGTTDYGLSSTNNMLFAAGGTGEDMRITSTGNVGIGTTSPATLLEVGGSTANVTFDGYKSCTGFTSDGNGKLACTASDQRLKNNIQAMSASSSLAALRSLAPVSFYWRDASPSGLEQYGFIAQDVMNVFPNLVQTTNPTELTPGGTMTVNYIGLIAPMIGAIQALDAKLGPLAGVLSVVPGVESQCVTGDTRLRRRRRRSDGEFEFDEIEIKNVVAGDEIQSLNERTGAVVYSRVNALVDMGTQEVFELVTRSGRRIRTTSNHPFLARMKAETV